MTLRTLLLSGLVAGALGATVIAAATPPGPGFHSAGDQAAVNRSFRSVLHRNPKPYEQRRYALLMNDYGWTEQDVRRDLSERSDYRRYSANSALDVDAIITRAYQDILGREPDPSGLQSNRKHIIQDGWSERDVRETLRQSPEYRSTARRTTSADGIIRRAYRDVLEQEPDSRRLDTYRRAIIEDGWDEEDVRQMLRRGDDGRGRREGDRARGQDHVTQVVRNAYLAVLHREPDANGLRDYGARVAQDHWSQADIERALRDSPEYRAKNR